MMKNLLYIGNKLSGKGLNTTIIETLSAQLSSEGYKVASFSAYKNPVLRMLDMLFAVIRYRKSDFVLIDTYSTSGFWFAFMVSLLCRLLHLKYIPILHGGNLPNRLKTHPKLCNMVFGNAYQNVAPSLYLMEAFKEYGFSNLTFIPNPLEIKRYHFTERSQIRPRLLWVRSFSEIYNPTMAVDVLYELKKIYPEASLCMVGPEKDGSLEICKTYAQNKQCEVLFTGKLLKEAWLVLSQEYDVFINTTHLDNTPVSVMEAMALGLPVVTTNVGGIPYLLNNGFDALLVDDNDVNAMVKAIQKLIENPEFSQKIIQNALEKTKKWDWSNVKMLWNKLLEVHNQY